MDATEFEKKIASIYKIAPEYLIALEIYESGKISLLYNGPGKFVWEIVKKQKQSHMMAQSEVSAKWQIPIKENLFNSCGGVCSDTGALTEIPTVSDNIDYGAPRSSMFLAG